MISLIPNDSTNPAIVDLIRDWPQEGVSTNAPLDNSHRLTHVHTTPSNCSASSALPITSWGKTVVRDKEQRSPTEKSHKSQKLGKRPTAVSSGSPLRPHEAPQGQHWCGTCRLGYVQQQGLTRHRRDVHEFSRCMYCDNFKWHRRDKLKQHLEVIHPDIDLSAALHEATRLRRAATIKNRGQRQRQQASPPPIGHPQLGFVKPRPHRSMQMLPSPRAAAQSIPISLSAMSFVNYGLQSEATESAIIEKCRHKDARPLELPNTNEDHSTSPSPADRGDPVTNPDMSAQNVRMWLVFCIPLTTTLCYMISDSSTTLRFQDKAQSISQVGFTAADSPSIMTTATALAPSLNISGFSGSGHGEFYS